VETVKTSIKKFTGDFNPWKNACIIFKGGKNWEIKSL